MLTTKNKTKKSKHGKKNWRKNIDITDIERSQRKLNQQKIQSDYVKALKDEDLFEIDETPAEKNKPLLGKKTKRKREPSKNEQRQIKRIIEISQTKAFQNNIQNQKKTSNNELYDLWGDSKNSKTLPSSNQIYPKVPLPHPGQSYNPNKKDLSKLLNTVVENNKYLVKKEEKTDLEINEFDDEKSEEITKPVANNEPVNDLNRLTKKEKRQKEIKKANKLINKQQEEQKRIKIAINNALGAKKIAKEQKKNEDKIKEQKKEQKKIEKIKNYEIKKGIFKDNELLEDFQVNKNQVPLRKIKEEINPLSERWNNIIKRKMIGEYTTKKRKPKNRKLNKIKYMDILGDDYFMEDKEIDIVE